MMNARQLLTLFTLAIFVIVGCSDSPGDPEMITDNTDDQILEQAIDMTPPEFYRDGVTPMSEIENLRKANQDTIIDPDFYDIIFEDAFGDFFYLNQVRHFSSDIGCIYVGKWIFKNKAYDLTAMYSDLTKSIALTGDYTNNRIITFVLFPSRSGKVYAGHWSLFRSETIPYLWDTHIKMKKGDFGLFLR